MIPAAKLPNPRSAEKIPESPRPRAFPGSKVHGHRFADSVRSGAVKAVNREQNGKLPGSSALTA